MWPTRFPASITASYFMLLLSGCGQNEQRMVPEAALIDSLKKPIVRTTLAQNTLHLLEEIEQGRLAGADSKGTPRNWRRQMKSEKENSLRGTCSSSTSTARRVPATKAIRSSTSKYRISSATLCNVESRSRRGELSQVG